MVTTESETSAESELLDELLSGQRWRSLQTHVAQSLSVNVWIVAGMSKMFEDIGTAPSPAVREQFEGSVDALEERLAKIAGLRLENHRRSDFSKRFDAIGVNRRENVRRIYRSILAKLRIDDTAPLTAVQRRQVKALIRNGFEGIGPDPGPDKDFVMEVLADLIASR
jgi:hypothetical protein